VEFAYGVFIGVSFKMLVWFEGKSLIFFWHGISKSSRDALGLHKELLTQIRVSLAPPENSGGKS
jgi:hypothetical protein